MSSRLVAFIRPNLFNSPVRSPGEAAKAEVLDKGLFQPDGDERLDISSINCCCLRRFSSPSNSMSKSMSLALRALFNRLPGSCKVGGTILEWFCHMFPPIGEVAPEGVMGGVELDGINIDEVPRASGLIDPMSRAEVLAENDLGEGTAEPVDAYRGRSSSGL